MSKEWTKGKWKFVGNIKGNKDEDHFYRDNANTWLSGPNGEPVLVPWDYESYSCGLHISEANARRICQCVNNFDVLVEALKHISEECFDAMEGAGLPEFQYYEHWHTKAEAALAEAEKE